MTRGNQRDLAREKNKKKQEQNAKKKGGDDGLTPQQRRERDGQRLQEKQAQKAGAQGSSSTS